MRRVLVVGGGRNIGRAVAERFGELGDHVAVNARGTEELDGVATSIRSAGGTAVAIPGDITSEDGVASIVGRAVEELDGTIDVLIYCATARMLQPVVETSLEEWHVPLRVGLDGVFLCSRAVLPGMVDASWGRIVLMTGLRGHTGHPNLTAVAAAKSGMAGFMRALAHEYAGTGVTVNAISPGRIATVRVGRTMGDADSVAKHDSARSEGIPVGRQGTGAEVAAACEYFASDAAGFVTGQVLHVNGGMFMP